MHGLASPSGDFTRLLHHKTERGGWRNQGYGLVSCGHGTPGWAWVQRANGMPASYRRVLSTWRDEEPMIAGLSEVYEDGPNAPLLGWVK